MDWEYRSGNCQLGLDRSHETAAEGKPIIPGSSDPAFRGDPTRYNPEELLVASLLATCSYLHLCAEAGIVVTDYVDRPVGEMIETDGGEDDSPKWCSLL